MDLIPISTGNEMMKLIVADLASAHRHRLNAFAISWTDQPGDVGWTNRALVLCRSAATNGASQRSRSACQFTSIDRLSKSRSAMNHRTADSGIPSCAKSAKVVLGRRLI